ncbi:MAG: MupA/Atu3671 family FMN-dependent luciferase-like monooxygenase [Caldilineaceae bacterium]
MNDYHELLTQALQQIKQLKAAKTFSTAKEDIAVVGVGCRFPGQVNNLDDYWSLLRNGIDAVSPIPPDRWSMDEISDLDQSNSRKTYCQWGGFLEDIDRFDASFFNISPREAAQIDPQQRILLEVCWEAIEHANYAPNTLFGSRTGVFVGMSSDDYSLLSLASGSRGIDVHTGTGLSRSVAAGRIAYFFGLQGPTMQIDTACSSSLVAIHLACQSLRNKECDKALAAGVNLLLSPLPMIALSEMGALSRMGKCSTFDKAADGYVRGEGCGVVFLKRLSDAVDDGDTILGVIRGSAINHGGRSNGLIAPNGKAQTSVIQAALEDAGVTPSHIAYLEAHGTGTPLGDPIEVNAFSEIYTKNREQDLFVGSVKSNFGHLEAAAGVAGFIKALLVLQNRQSPPQINFHTPSPYISWDKLAIRISRDIESLPNDRNLFAAVSSFGISGTNAHLILGLPETDLVQTNLEQKFERPFHILSVSAKSTESLARSIDSYSNTISKLSADISDLCYTANTARDHFPNRVAIIASNASQFDKLLREFPNTSALKGSFSGTGKYETPKIGFAFSGQGSVFAYMGGELYRTQPVFREHIDRCDEIINRLIDKPLKTIMFSENSKQLLTDALYAQPALFSVEYALAKLWMNWGVRPNLFIGHSFGEYVAACLAGAFSLDDALKLICERARLTHQLSGYGQMMGVLADRGNVEEILSRMSDIYIGAINGPSNVVISGTREQIKVVGNKFESLGIYTKVLNIPYPAHCPLAESILPEFRELLTTIDNHSLNTPMVLTITGDVINKGEKIPSEYWCKHVVEPVDFVSGLSASAKSVACNTFIEIGPDDTLSKIGRAIEPSISWLPSILGESEWEPLLSSLCALYVKGQDINWHNFDDGYARKRVAIPTYTFDRKRFWVKSLTKNKSDLDEGVMGFAKVKSTILDTLINHTAQLLRVQRDQVDEYTTLIQLGADSLTISEARLRIKDLYGVEMSFSQLFEEYTNLEKIAHYIAERTLSQDLPSRDPLSEPHMPTKEEGAMPRITTPEHDLQDNDKLVTVTSNLRHIVAELLHSSPDDIDINAPFLEMGADSLVLIEAIRKIENVYDVTINVRQFFEQLVNIKALAAHILEHSKSLIGEVGAPYEVAKEKVLPESQLNDDFQPFLANQLYGSAIGETAKEGKFSSVGQQEINGIEDIITRQIALMTQQLEVLQSHRLLSPDAMKVLDDAKGSNSPNRAEQVRSKDDVEAASPNTIFSSLFSPIGIAETEKKKLSTRQHRHHKDSIERYIRKTKTSKELTQYYRAVLADNRASAGFRFSTKEILYPIIGDRADGSRIWDIDGNEYVDIAMGFGVNLFGHKPQFITDAIKEELAKGMPLGPQTRLAGEVAELICEFTAMDRVTFCNTGTDAVMLALRLARTATGRNKIALFAGSYHGHFDGVLAMAKSSTNPQGIPAVSGVSPNLVADIMVLEYGDPEAIKLIQESASELAAVLVEPVQSRRPDLQPRKFLHDLRDITQKSGIALVFDEVITGFRIHPGGAQAWFEVEADLAAYGKVLGGGLPIGCVAGKSIYMNGVDGGVWNYGDDSYPSVNTTFFAGTFCKHPLSMAAARAVLLELKAQGPDLQQRLNQRTADLADALNSFFEHEEVPIHVVHFGSLFRFSFSANLDLFFYYLAEEGVYTWEGRNCMLSTAHTDEDIQHIINAAKRSIEELRKEGVLPSRIAEENLLEGIQSFEKTLSNDTPTDTTKNKSSANISLETAMLEWGQHISQHKLDEYVSALAYLNRLSAGFIAMTLEKLGVKLTPPNWVSVEDVSKLNIEPQYTKLIRQMFSIMSSEGWVRNEGNGWRILQDFDYQAFRAMMEDFAVLYPIAMPEFDIVRACGENLHEILRGIKQPQQVIFAQGDMGDLATNLYHRSFGNSISTEAVKYAVDTLCKQYFQNDNMNILEIGAGTGASALSILSILDKNRSNFWFTDISRVFLSKAQKLLAAYPQVRYQQLDIEKSPFAQGFDANAYDMVIAANVLHSTEELRVVLQNIMGLLKPGGFLLLVEATSQQNWLDITFGLTKGWWRFKDHDLRPDYPLVSSNRWEALLDECGFELVIKFPNNSYDHSPQQHMIIARVPNNVVLANSSIHSTTEPVEAITKTKKIPLTPSQKQLWVLNSIGDGVGGFLAYNICFGLQLVGEVQLDILKQALQEIVNRHEALRTIFDDTGDYQYVLSSFEVRLDETDFSEHDSSERETRIAEWFKANGQEPFPLQKEPLFRAHIIRLQKEKHILVITTHHIVSDGWSFTVISKELSTIYSAMCKNIAWNIEEPMQFSEYAHWLSEKMKTPKMRESEAYWLNLFAENVPSMDIPTDFPRPAVKSFSGARVTTTVDSNLYDEISRFGTSRNCTLFMTLLSAYTALLHRVTGQNKVIVSVPVVGRSLTGSEHLVGFCANQLPILSCVSSDTTFQEHLIHIRQVLLDAYEHQDYPYAEIINNLSLRRDLSLSPLAATIFNLNPASELPVLDRLDVDWFSEHIYFIGDEINLHVTKVANRLVLDCDFNTDLFTRDRIQGMLNSFIELARDAVRRPDGKLWQLSMLDKFERRKLLFEWNQTSRTYPQSKCIHEYFSDVVDSKPNDIALVFNDEQMTYDQLHRKSNRLARYLDSVGIGPDKCVALIIDRSIEMVVSILAILKAGGAYVPIDVTTPIDRIAAIIRDSQIQVTITQQKYVGNIPEELQALILVDKTDLWSVFSDNNLVKRISSQELAYVIYTSGSTGAPKGIQVEHRQVSNFFAGMDDVIRVDKNDTWLAVTAISFDISVLEILWTLCRGMKVVIQGGRDSIIEPATPNNTSAPDKSLDFSLFFFGTAGKEDSTGKYDLLLESSKYADQNGFHAIWTPERHFHEFGGKYPNPAITSAAIATITNNIHLRSGSIVLPLHDPIVVAENWSVVDNISNGRIGVSFASGWQTDDFVLAPEKFPNRKQLLEEGVKSIRKLWAGETVRRINGSGNPVNVQLYPSPIQKELPIWITAAGNPETFRLAGRLGANLLTHLLGQSIAELGHKITIYREALRAGGHKSGRVTLMLHTYVSENTEDARKKVRGPLIEYLRSSFGLMNRLAQDLGGDLSSLNNVDALLSQAFDRYFETSGLFGSRDRCVETIDTLRKIGVDEIACLIDFGIDTNAVMKSLELLNSIRSSVYKGDESISDYSVSRNIQKHRVTHMQCTPSFAQMLAYHSETLRSLSSLKVLLLGGEVLNTSLLEKLKETVNGEIFNMYGPTETTIWSTVCRVDDKKMTLIGRPIANTRVYILDQSFQPVPVGMIGQLCIGGDGVTRGYQNLPDLTQKRFIVDPFLQRDGERIYCTGDLARFLPDGNIEFIGRIDEQVKIRGYRIELGEIEHILSIHPMVEDVVVVAKDDTELGKGKYLAAYVKLKSGESIVTIDLRSHLRKHLPDYMIPPYIVEMESIPRTPNGKHDRKLLAEINVSFSETKTEYLAPRNETEQTLVDIWQKFLGIDRVGIHDNYFDLGGTSILAVRISSEANKAGLSFTLRQLMSHHTIAELAQVANTSVAVEVAQEVVTGPVPLTPIQHWFFGNQKNTPERYNQHFLIQTFQSLNADIVSRIVAHLVNQHDALRLRFVQQEGVWKQFHASVEEVVPFFTHDLRNMDMEAQAAHFEVILNELHDQIHISNGPVFSVALFKLGNDQSDRLVITAHHLVIDGISWRVLLEEFAQAYTQLMAGMAINLPKKTTSYQLWSNKLIWYAQSEDLLQDAEYWLNNLPSGYIGNLPIDHQGVNAADSVDYVHVQLNKRATSSLVSVSQAVNSLRSIEVLVSVLGIALTHWMNENQIYLHIEGHGREPLFDDVDISRTVGWFTSLYPIFLRISQNRDTLATILNIAQQIRKVPRNGISYGLLRYLTEGGSYSQKLSASPSPQILFNFHGQLDYDLLQTLGAVSSVTRNFGQGRTGFRDHILEIEAYIKDGVLNTYWVFSQNLHDKSTVVALAEEFNNLLIQFLSDSSRS